MAKRRKDTLGAIKRRAAEARGIELGKKLVAQTGKVVEHPVPHELPKEGLSREDARMIARHIAYGSTGGGIKLGDLYTPPDHEALAEEFFKVLDREEFPHLDDPEKRPKHPHRYPKHEGIKGTVFGGVCNRTACNSHNAIYFNRATYGYYCPTDGRAINWESDRNPKIPLLCIVVDHPLTIEEMEKSSKEYQQQRWQAKPLI